MASQNTGFSYQEYLRRNPYAGTQRHGEDNSSFNYAPLVSEAEWNALGAKGQWELMEKPSDASVDYSEHGALDGDAQAFRSKFGAGSWGADASGRPELAGQYITGYGDPARRVKGMTSNPGSFADYAIDPSRVLKLDDGRWVIEGDNVKGDWLADQQDKTASKRKKKRMIAGSLMAGGALAAAGGLGGLAGGAGYGNAGMIAPGMGNAAALDSFLINNGMSQFAGGAMTGLASGAPGAHLGGSAAGASSAAGGGLGSLGGLGESLGGLGIKDVVRGGLGLASLSQLGKDPEGGPGGSSGDAASIIDQMANANRVDMNTPLGSRKWAKGQDGRWTVNDTMNPAEQANFEGVQGMNAGVTGMARDRLAELLANPQKKRAGPVSYGQFNIGD